jgi:hypothetical protein
MRAYATWQRFASIAYGADLGFGAIWLRYAEGVNVKRPIFGAGFIDELPPGAAYPPE